MFLREWHSVKALIQRVTRASVEVEGATVGAIDHGLLALVGVEKGDSEAAADKLLHKLLHYRVFNDADGKMNHNLQQAGGDCCWYRSSPWPLRRIKGCGPVFKRRAPRKASGYLIIW